MLKVINLQIRDRGVACVHLVAFSDHRLGKILKPAAFSFIHLNKSGFQVCIVNLGLGVL